MGKLLILGASSLQLPAIIKAKELGHYVGVIDFNPLAIGIKYADEYFNISTTDIDSVCSAAYQFHPDGILTLATDMPVRSLAAATTMLNLPGVSVETALKSTDKAEMIKTFEKHNIDSPWYYIINDEWEIKRISDKLKFPCILKPTDSAGSRGVILVQGLNEIASAYYYSKENSRCGKVIIEEYMIGSEVSVEVLVVDGKINILSITDKLTSGAPFFVEMGHSQYSQQEMKSLEKIKNLTIKAVTAIGINSGPAHVEIIITNEGPKMVELGARMGGDYITTHLIPLSTGIDMVKASIDVSLGLSPDISPKFNKGSAIRYFELPCGILSSITGIDQTKLIDGVIDCTFTKNVGDRITPIKSSLDRGGCVIAQGTDAKEAIKICQNAMRKITFEVK